MTIKTGHASFSARVDSAHRFSRRYKEANRATKQLAISLFLCLILSSSIFFGIMTISQASSSSLTCGISGNTDSKVIWEKTYGGMGDDRAFDGAKAKDGYLVVGSSTSQILNTTVAWILRLDRNGNAVWNRTYLESMGSEFRHAIALDDGFLLVGNVFYHSGDQDGFVVRISDDGTRSWNITVGGDKVDKLFSASVAETGDFILAGLTNSFGARNSDAWVVRIDGEGNVLWNQTYGGSFEDAGRSIVSSGSGSYIIGGYTNSRGNGDYDFLVLAIDGSGRQLWNRTYGGKGSDKAYAVAVTDGKYVVAGDTQSQGNGNYDAWVIKIDSSGTLLWQKTLGGQDYDSASTLTGSWDGGFLIGGFTLSFGNGMRDIFLSKIDSDGNTGWSLTLGRSGYEEAYGVVEQGKDQLLVAGWTDYTGRGRYDFYVANVGIETHSADSNSWLLYVVFGFGVLLLGFFAVLKVHVSG